MAPRQYGAPSVRQLAAVVDRMAGGVSQERLRQLRMVVGMWDRALGSGGMPVAASREAQRMFTRPALVRFWDLAVAGELRHFDRDRGKPLPDATLRIVRDCLGILALSLIHI